MHVIITTFIAFKYQNTKKIYISVLDFGCQMYPGAKHNDYTFNLNEKMEFSCNVWLPSNNPAFMSNKCNECCSGKYFSPYQYRVKCYEIC